VSRSRRWSEVLVAAGALVALTSCGRSGGEAALDWTGGAPASGRVVDGALQIDASGQPASYPLVTIDDPDVAAPGYALQGQIRYQDVDQPGYLEMWSVFPDGRRYFSRTLASIGPLAAIQGTSDWRPFQLPFSLEGTTQLPDRLEVNLVLAGRGHVWIRPMRLVVLGTAEEGAWWSDRTAGIVGGVGGTLVGVTGALFGDLASRGRSRRAVFAAMTALLLLGVGLLALGVVAFAVSQPTGVTGSLFIGGAVLTGVMGIGLRTVRGVYARAELRRMRALDAAA
jgi:hypothetical protein